MMSEAPRGRPDTMPQFVLSGEIDISNADSVRVEGVCLARDAAPSPLVADLVGVTFIDSSGIAALISIHNAARAAGGSLVLRSMSPSVLRLFELAGLAHEFSTDYPA